MTIYEQTIDKWGAEFQADMAIEECAELIVALRSYARGRVDIRAVAEEVADVEIMCQHLRVVAGQGLVDQIKEYKLSRLQDRIDGKVPVQHGR
jgi:NTP pyrophosphatase (non-canonical NTP hydrolase)